MSEKKSLSKEYNELIKVYTSNIKKAYLFSKKNYNDIYVFDNISLLEHSLNIAKKLNVYDENVIISSILYNPYKYEVDIKKAGFYKNIRKICKDVYFFNFLDLVKDKNFSPKKIKEMIVNSFFKIEAIIIVFGEALVILDYFSKIKDDSFKERFLDVIENAILPLSYQLGMQNVKEDILKQLMHLKYKDNFDFINNYVTENYPYKNLEVMKEIIINYLKSKNHKPINYNYRYKSPGSIFQKLFIRKEKSKISEVLDVYALRLIYNSKKDCYKALRFIVNNFDLIEDFNVTIRDYIKHPKKNGYQSIHLNIMLDKFPLEIQIRTIDMHNNAEFGISAHFHYKNIESSEKDTRLINYLKQKTIIEKPRDRNYKDYIFVYTQTNQEIMIPKKSTVLDFAFHLHTDFAKYFDFAKINDKIVTDKGYLLKNGDKIKIFRSKRETIKKQDCDNIFVHKNKKKLKLILNCND
jgi:GTP diphosphokinase / guanosine-3',5'-bis(diphosphate) 3'-diphosphatase